MNSVDPTLLNLDSLLNGEWNQLRALLIHSYTAGNAASNNNPQAEIDTIQLSGLLRQGPIGAEQSLINFIQLQLKPTETLSGESFAVLKFIDQLFDNYEKNCKLHPIISQALKPFRLNAAIKLLNRQLPWHHEQGLMAVLDSIYAHTIGWQPELGRAGNRFLLQLTELINNSSDDNNIIADDINAFFAREQQRIDKLESRLHAAELGTLHAKHAQQLSAKTLNQKMAGKKLPARISQFLQGPWHESMRLTIINYGDNSKEWQKIIRLTETLVWTFQPIDEDSAEFQQHVYQAIAELSEQLREVTIGLHHSSNLDEELASVEQEHLKILKGQALTYHPIQLIDNKNPFDSSQVSISSSLIKQACSYNEGSWFIYTNNGEQQRIKLAVKINQAKQLLLTNLIGIKVDQLSFEEFAYRLSSKIIIPLPTQNPFKIIAEKIIASLLQRLQQQLEQTANTASIEEEKRAQKQAAQLAAHNKAIAEAEALAAIQKAEKEKAEKDAIMTAQLARMQQREKDIYQQLSKLNIGAVICFNNQQGSKDSCKLVAVIQSSGDHIFVNREGIKQYVLTREKLADKLLSNTAEIIDLGSNFENTLEQVVNTLRTRK